MNGKSGTRRIPEAVLRSPQPVVAAFLRGLFEGDGAVERSGQSLLRVSLCSNSDELLRQVQTLLLRFGIVCSRFADAKRGTHRLCIVGHDNLHALRRQDRLRLGGQAPGAVRRAGRQLRPRALQNGLHPVPGRLRPPAGRAASRVAGKEQL